LCSLLQVTGNDTHTHTHTQTYIQTQTYTQTHTQTQTHTHTDTHTDIHTHTQTHTDIHTDTHTHTHTNTQTHGHTHRHIHTQIHTHTHTHPLLMDTSHVPLCFKLTPNLRAAQLRCLVATAKATFSVTGTVTIFGNAWATDNALLRHSTPNFDAIQSGGLEASRNKVV
jgi:hypothetical protein